MSRIPNTPYCRGCYEKREQQRKLQPRQGETPDYVARPLTPKRKVIRRLNQEIVGLMGKLDIFTKAACRDPKQRIVEIRQFAQKHDFKNALQLKTFLRKLLKEPE